MVGDLVRSVAFYRRLFGFEAVKRLKFGESNIVLLDIGDGVLEIIQREDGAVPQAGSHIALLEPGFDQRVKILEEMGVEKRLVPGLDDDRLCFFYDPDGHMVELTELGLGS